ncbi:hypothetical protein [Rhodovibrio salinarum]|uniref:ParB/Sulfiredoxin domain-containing protein n=1 Tax=Rhodovibrio salinarum TaxID=1087 RepID=A0A934QLU7_9PROT|nr:hypothetical protein [Rhodovibrio salinarum]MBK1699211.1 hypothetical protein [Rhodovibrio salinarum]
MAVNDPATATAARAMGESDRAQAIHRALAEGASGQHSVPTDDGYLTLPVVSLPPDALVYRADNGRILSELVDAGHAHDTTVDDLKARSESADVQALLGGILLEKARDPDGPIYAELARYAHQTEPLLVDRTGVVVNGNRRLAAMRALRAQDPDAYAGFAQVAAAVLPENVGRDRLEYIEAALQMAPELKLPYSWINRRLKLRQHVADLDRARVAKAYRLADPSAIDTELAELALAESYLAWRGTPDRYEHVADQEQRFVQLNARLDAINAPHMAALWTRIGFAMLRAQDGLDRDIDHYFPFAKPAPQAIVQWVPRALAAEYGLTDPPEPGQVRPVNQALADTLRARIDEPADAQRTARGVMGLIDTLKGNEDTYLGPERVVHHLRMARDAIEALGVDNLPERQQRRIQAEMAALGQHTDALLDGRRTGRPMTRDRERRLPGPARWLVRRIRLVLNG